MSSPIRTFLIADIRGYTRFTEEYGDEAAARLASKFRDIVQEVVETRNGRVVELRGDEALSEFESARQAIRAAMDMQRMFAEETDADRDLPLRVGIGIDSGEAIELEDGSFRGSALNVSARLSAAAHGEEVLVSEATSRLAGHVPGLRYVDRGRLSLKGVGAVHGYRVAWEDEKEPNNWFFVVFGKSERTAPKIIAIAVLVAAVTAAAVVWLTTGKGADESQANPAGGPTATQPSSETTGSTGGEVNAPPSLDAIVPPQLWAECQIQTVPDEGAIETAVCLPAQNTGKFAPDRWQVSIYPDGRTLMEVYDSMRKAQGIAKDSGRCGRFSWTGEGAWEHGPGQRGGRRFCYFDGDDAVEVWVHEKLDQPSHRDVLGIVREGGSDHAGLTHWWNPWHHLIGKANE